MVFEDIGAEPVSSMTTNTAFSTGDVQKIKNVNVFVDVQICEAVLFYVNPVRGIISADFFRCMKMMMDCTLSIKNITDSYSHPDTRCICCMHGSDKIIRAVSCTNQPDLLERKHYKRVLSPYDEAYRNTDDLSLHRDDFDYQVNDFSELQLLCNRTSIRVKNDSPATARTTV